jgi:ribose transport system substrate-binding protein
MTGWNRTGRRVAAAGVAGVVLLATSALGLAGSRPARASASGVAKAEAAIKAAEQMPKLLPIGPHVDMAKLRKQLGGKKIWVLTSALNVPFVAAIVQGIQQAAKVAGLNVLVLDGQGNVAKWNSDLEQAVSEHAPAVISVAASPVVMKSGMAKAKAAHIPVIDVLTADQASPLVPGTYAHVSISFYRSGELQADYVIAQSHGKANVLIFGDNEFPGEVTRVQGMEHQFHALCPACHVTVKDTQVASLATQLPSLTQTLLRRNPSITWVLPTYDAQAVYIVPAIRQMGLSKTVHVVSSDAVPSNLQWVKQGNVETADVGEPDIWTGWASIDEIARALLGMRPVTEPIPLRLFIQSNMKTLSPNNEYQLWGGKFQHAYETVWGVH